MKFSFSEKIIPFAILTAFSLILFFIPHEVYAEDGVVQDIVSGVLGGLGGLGGLFDLTAGGLTYIGLVVIRFLVSIVANIVLLAGNVLAAVITLLILEMGNFINGPAASGIREAWTIIRDIANIGIVGGLIATAVGTIIQNKTYNISATLARLIVAALLINFSYFFAGAIIDVANFGTIAVYNETVITSTCAPGSNAAAGSLGALRDLGGSRVGPGLCFFNSLLEVFGFRAIAEEGGGGCYPGD